MPNKPPSPTALRKSVEIIVLFTPIIIALIGIALSSVISVFSSNPQANSKLIAALTNIFFNYGPLIYLPIIISGFVYSISGIYKNYEYMLLAIAALLSIAGFGIGVGIFVILGIIVGPASIFLMILILVAVAWLMIIIRPLLERMQAKEYVALGNIIMAFSFLIILIIPQVQISNGQQGFFIWLFVLFYMLGYVIHYFKRIVKSLQSIVDRVGSNAN